MRNKEGEEEEDDTDFSATRPAGAPFPSSVAQLGGGSGRNGGSGGSGGGGAEESGGSTGLGEENAGSGGVGSGGETQDSRGSLVLVKAKTNPGVDPRLAESFVGRCQEINDDGTAFVTSIVGPQRKRLVHGDVMESCTDGYLELFSRGNRSSGTFTR